MILFLPDRLPEETGQSSTQTGKHGRKVLNNGMTRLSSPSLDHYGNDTQMEAFLISGNSGGVVWQ